MNPKKKSIVLRVDSIPTFPTLAWGTLENFYEDYLYQFLISIHRVQVFLCGCVSDDCRTSFKNATFLELFQG